MPRELIKYVSTFPFAEGTTGGVQWQETSLIKEWLLRCLKGDGFSENPFPGRDRARILYLDGFPFRLQTGYWQVSRSAGTLYLPNHPSPAEGRDDPDAPTMPFRFAVLTGIATIYNLHNDEEVVRALQEMGARMLLNESGGNHPIIVLDKPRVVETIAVSHLGMALEDGGRFYLPGGGIVDPKPDDGWVILSLGDPRGEG